MCLALKIEGVLQSFLNRNQVAFLVVFQSQYYQKIEVYATGRFCKSQEILRYGAAGSDCSSVS